MSLKSVIHDNYYSGPAREIRQAVDGDAELVSEIERLRKHTCMMVELLEKYDIAHKEAHNLKMRLLNESIARFHERE